MRLIEARNLATPGGAGSVRPEHADGVAGGDHGYSPECFEGKAWHILGLGARRQQASGGRPSAKYDGLPPRGESIVVVVVIVTSGTPSSAVTLLEADCRIPRRTGWRCGRGLVQCVEVVCVCWGRFRRA